MARTCGQLSEASSHIDELAQFNLDPIELNYDNAGMTVGACVTGGGSAGPMRGGASGCVVDDGENFAATGTGQGGLGGGSIDPSDYFKGSFSLGLSLMVSNAESTDNLAGQAVCVAFSAGVKFGGSLQACAWGSSDTWTLSNTIGLQTGVDMAVTYADTVVSPKAPRTPGGDPVVRSCH